MNRNNILRLKKIDITSLVLMGVICWAYYLKYQLLFTININWDEFRFLSRIYDYLRGDTVQKLQTFYIHFFTWLPAISVSEVDQIIAGRQVMYVLSIGSSFSLWLIGRRLMNSAGALFAVCCSLSFSNYQHHGSSFRFDSILVFLFLLSTALLLERHRFKGLLLIASLLIATSFMVSIKAVFFIPTWGVILLLHNSLTENKKVFAWQNLKDCIQCAMAVCIFGVLLFFLHSASLPAAASVGDTGNTRSLREIWKVMILWETHFPQFIYLLTSLKWDEYFWTLFFFGLLLTAGDAVHLTGRRRFQAIMLLSLAFPLLSLVVYRNSFPYYYVTIIPSASLLLGGLVSRLSFWLPKKSLVAFILTLLLIFPVLQRFKLGYANNQQSQIHAQQELIDTVHAVFPSPVPYIDRCSMVAAYPKVGLFMTTWITHNYRVLQQPIMKEILVEKQPKFLINNITTLNLKLPWSEAGNRGQRLLEEDFVTLQANFVHYWGYLWVPGKKLELKNIKQPEKFEILIEGTYQIEANGMVSLDGTPYNSGQSLLLKQGIHEVVALESPGTISLFWGGLIDKSSRPVSPQTLFKYL